MVTVNLVPPVYVRICVGVGIGRAAHGAVKTVQVRIGVTWGKTIKLTGLVHIICISIGIGKLGRAGGQSQAVLIFDRHLERSILAALEGGCQVPMGAYARIEGDRLVVDAVVLSVDGSRVARARFEGNQLACEEAADSIVSQLVEGGAREILEEIRKAG